MLSFWWIWCSNSSPCIPRDTWKLQMSYMPFPPFLSYSRPWDDSCHIVNFLKEVSCKNKTILTKGWSGPLNSWRVCKRLPARNWWGNMLFFVVCVVRVVVYPFRSLLFLTQKVHSGNSKKPEEHEFANFEVFDYQIHKLGCCFGCVLDLLKQLTNVLL